VVLKRNTYRITNSRALGWKMQGGEKWHETAPKNVVTSAKNSTILFTLLGSYFNLEYLQMLLNYTLKKHIPVYARVRAHAHAHTHTQCFLPKTFFNRPVKKKFLKMET
jgi:hypothetical protein